MTRTYTYAPKPDVQCPFCSHLGGQILYEVSSTQAALHFVPHWRNESLNSRLKGIIESLWGGTCCQVVQCDCCKGGFAFPFVSGNAEFYETANSEQHVGSYPPSRWEYAESLKLLENPQSVRALEIGAGDGAFIRRLIGAGVAPEAITALEYSSYGLESISSIDPRIEVKHGNQMDSLHADRFSHVFLFQVMEHLGNLDAVLTTVRAGLISDGLVFISVPHPDQVALHELSGLTLDMPPNHISRFSKDAMGELARRNGLKLERVVDEGFSWAQSFPEFLRFHFLYLAQREGSLHAKIHSSLRGKSHKYAVGLLSLFLVPHALYSLAAGPKCGSTRLFVLRRNG